MWIDRRKFLNFAAANTVATAIYPLDAEQGKKRIDGKERD
jgi:hypothetical protein